MEDVIISNSEVDDNRSYTSIDFDINNNRIYKIQEKFGITQTDRIIAVYSTNRLIGISDSIDIVFTDRCAYTLIGRKRPLFNFVGFSGLYFKYSDLCKYIISHEKNAVTLVGYNNKISIQKKPLTTNLTKWTICRDELEIFLEKLQKVIINRNKEKDIEYRNTIDLFYVGIREKLDRYMPIDDESQMNILKKNKSSMDEYNIVIIQDFNLTEIEKMECDKKNDNDYGEDRAVGYVEKYIKDIKDPNLYTPIDVVRRRIRSINKIEKGRHEYKNRVCKALITRKSIFELYYSLREKPYISTEEIEEQCINLGFTKEEIIEAVRFAHIYTNYLMSCILEELKRKEIQSISEWKDFKDVAGMNCMHYAILTNNDTIVKKSISYYRKYRGNDNLKRYVGYDPYDYAFVAYVIGNGELGQFLFENTGDIKNLKEAASSLRKMIEAQRKIVKYKKGKNSIRGVYFGEDSIDYSVERIQYLEKDLEEIEEKIKQTRERFYNNIEIWKKRMNESSFLRALKGFYLDPCSLSLFLQEIKKHLSVEDKDGIHIRIDIFSDNNSFNGRDETEVKPYGSSWFSPEAHHNYDVLRKEYYTYAKKYHPDNNVGTEEIFREINDERVEILQSL